MFGKLKVGQKVRIDKYRGEAESFLGTVVSIRDLHKEPVERDSHRRRKVTRSQFLFTLQAQDKTTKSYYHAFCEGELL